MSVELRCFNGPKPSEKTANGLIAISQLLNYWVSMSTLPPTDGDIVTIASWALGEEGFLHKSTLSRARNKKLPTGVSMRALLALSKANEALFRWQVWGPDDAINSYGHPSLWGIPDNKLDLIFWLPHPSSINLPKTSKKALNFVNLCEVQMGILELPYLEPFL